MPCNTHTHTQMLKQHIQILPFNQTHHTDTSNPSPYISLSLIEFSLSYAHIIYLLATLSLCHVFLSSSLFSLGCVIIVIVVNIIIHMHIRVSNCSGGEVTRQRQESRANNEVRKPTHPRSSPTLHVPRLTRAPTAQHKTQLFFYTFTVDTRTPHAAAAHRHLNPVFSPLYSLFDLFPYIFCCSHFHVCR